MIHAKNYKTATKFVKVMPRILWPLFFPGHGVYRKFAHSVIQSQEKQYNALHHLNILQADCSRPNRYSTLILGVFPLDPIADVGVSPSQNRKLISREIILKYSNLCEKKHIPECHIRTDRQTDL